MGIRQFYILWHVASLGLQCFNPSRGVFSSGHCCTSDLDNWPILIVIVLHLIPWPRFLDPEVITERHTACSALFSYWDKLICIYNVTHLAVPASSGTPDLIIHVFTKALAIDCLVISVNGCNLIQQVRWFVYMIRYW